MTAEIVAILLAAIDKQDGLHASSIKANDARHASLPGLQSRPCVPDR